MHDDDCRDFLNDRLFDIEERLASLEGRPTILFKKLHPQAVLPKYMTGGAIGLDLFACNDNPIVIHQGADAILIPTGLAIELPEGYEAQVRSRSSLSLQGVTVANSPGTIDFDFRGELCVIIKNSGRMFTVHGGDRIAQLIIAKAVQAQIKEVTELSETVRGTGARPG